MKKKCAHNSIELLNEIKTVDFEPKSKEWAPNKCTHTYLWLFLLVLPLLLLLLLLRRFMFIIIFIIVQLANLRFSNHKYMKSFMFDFSSGPIRRCGQSAAFLFHAFVYCRRLPSFLVCERERAGPCEWARDLFGTNFHINLGKNWTKPGTRRRNERYALKKKKKKKCSEFLYGKSTNV